MTEKRFKVLLLTLLIGLCFSSILNQIFGSIDLRTDHWVFPRILPTLNPPLGIDLSITVKKSLALLQGTSPFLEPEFYPPFVFLLYIPFAFLNYHTAYCLQVLLLCFANFLSLYLILDLSGWAYEKIWKATSFQRLFAQSLCLFLVTAQLLTSYGFLFSIERGNIDAYALIFSVLFLWIILKKPERIWLATFALAVAIHIKVYPLILGVLLVWKYGKKSVVPFLILNLLLLFSLGIPNGIHFVIGLRKLMGEPYVWIGNHSAYAWVRNTLSNSSSLSSWTAFFTVLPVGIWLVSAVKLFKAQFNEMGALLLFGISIPLMEVLPSTSNDYKLVITYAMIAILYCFFSMAYLQKGKISTLFSLMVLLFFTAAISRSYTLISSPWIANKYGFIVLLQVLFAGYIFSVDQLESIKTQKSNRQRKL